jgi:(2Fe-2S) ferredoxin
LDFGRQKKLVGRAVLRVALKANVLFLAIFEAIMLYEKHIFICVNQRAEGERVSCGEVKGMELVNAFKEGIKKRGLKTKVRAQKTGCLDICEWGPNVVVYPEGIFYGKVQLGDVEEILEKHVVNNRPVERLILKFSK